MSSGELMVCGAVYGRADVTEKVKALVQNKRLSVKASNSVFGDSWPNVVKSLVVVYKYNGSIRPQVKIAKEHETLTITPDSHSGKGATWSGSHLPPTPLTILGAAYGLKDVTDKAAGFLVSSAEDHGVRKFEQVASNRVWGDGWPGKLKTLVVVYECNNRISVKIAVENERMTFATSPLSIPPIKILGAAYGLHCVTDKATELMNNCTFRASNATFGDTWYGVRKSLVIVYQYGEETPVVGIAKEGEQLELVYTPRPAFTRSNDLNTLNVLGAVYGSSDVTARLQEMVTVQGYSSLSVKASNSVFGDSWYGVRKTLVVVYQYGPNVPKVKVVQEGQTLTIARPTVPVPPSTDLYNGSNLFSNGERLCLKSFNGNYICCDPNGRLIASLYTPEYACKLTVVKTANQSVCKLFSDNGYYIVIGYDGCLYATGVYENASYFTMSVSAMGCLYLRSQEKYVSLIADDSTLRAVSTDHLSATTALNFALYQTEPVENAGVVGASRWLESLSISDKASAMFIWSLTGGFFLAVGLGPLVDPGAEPKPGILSLIRSNKRAFDSIENLRTQVSCASGLVATPAVLSVMRVLYEEGLLWSVFKWMLRYGYWWDVTASLAKITQVLYLPEAEVSQLLTTWVSQTAHGGLPAYYN